MSEDRKPKKATPRNRQRRHSAPSGPEDPTQVAARAVQGLYDMAATFAKRRGLTTPEIRSLGPFVIPVVIRPGRTTSGKAPQADVAALVARVEQEIQEAAAARSAFQEGRVYCFFCGSSDCTHATPPEPTDTFSGYSALGKPQWQSFPNFCIALGERRVDAVYADPPEVIAVAQEASDLDADMLPGFGSDSLVFNVLGQVVAGLVPTNLNPIRPAPTRVAWTIQVLETRSGNEKRRLRLNMLGISMWDLLEAAATARQREAPERLRRTVAIARRRVETLGRRVASAERRGEDFDLPEAVRPVLARLRNDIERDLREPARRTHHARERHQSESRPTSNALRDARNAPVERLLFDTARQTVVVLGPRGRAHVFTREGRHVTSLQLEPGELDRKLGRGRWRPLEADMASRFSDTIRRGVTHTKGTRVASQSPGGGED